MKHVGDLGNLEMRPKPQEWPEGIAICNNDKNETGKIDLL